MSLEGATTDAHEALPEIPGLTLVRELGRGGMAVVYEAIARDGKRVAVKILHDVEEDRTKRFMAECDLVKRIEDSAIVPIYDLTRTTGGAPACTMELVPGETLEALMQRGEVGQRRALAVVASTAKALTSVHAAGIVHRDVKPSNILVEPEGRVRLLDFGIARDLRSGNAVAEREVFGTPNYLAPEQAQALVTSPATDVWALGVILYELLTGALPFAAAQLRDLIYAIVVENPIPPRALNPALAADLELVVLRCLAKSPDERFTSGLELSQALEAILGTPAAAALAPTAVPRLGPATKKLLASRVQASAPLPKRDGAPVHYRFTWDLASAPALLWPHVSNTEKFNRAIGLPAVEFTDDPDGQGGVQRIGRFRRLGMDIEWVEHPFEWLAPERQSVLRVYRRGPLEALWSEVVLTPLPGGGTNLVHEIWIAPRGALGLLASFIEVRLRAKGKIEEVYRKLDEHARRRGTDPLAPSTEDARALADPYAQRTKLTAAAEVALGASLASLRETGRPWTRWLHVLEAEVRDAPDPEVACLRPFRIARRWVAPRTQVLSLFLAAVRAGLLEIEWQLLCPLCRVPTSSLASLSSVQTRSHCNACDVTYDNDFASSIELVFRPNPAIRPVQAQTFCLGGPGNFPHVVAQQILEPRESRSLNVRLEPGSYRVAARGIKQGAYEFVVKKEALASSAHVAIEEASIRSGPPALMAGVAGFTLENQSGKRRVVRIENAAWREDILTALDACGLAELQALGRETAPGQPVKVARATFLAASVGAEAPLPALQALDACLLPILEECGGARISKPFAFAVFGDAAAAIEAAIRLQESVADARSLASFPLRTAVQTGAAVASSIGGRLSYEGRAPETTVALLETCRGGEIATTHLVLGAPNVSDLVGTRETRAQALPVGAEGELPIVYLGA